MPKTFLHNSIDAFNRGWQQTYGRPRHPVPVAENPAIGAPVGADDDPEDQVYPGPKIVYQPPAAEPQPAPTPRQQNAQVYSIDREANITPPIYSTDREANVTPPVYTTDRLANVSTPTVYPAPKIVYQPVRPAATQQPVVRRALPVNAPTVASPWVGNPTMAQVGPAAPTAPTNFIQAGLQSLGHLFGFGRTGPGSPGHPYYGTPYAYGTPEYASYWNAHWGQGNVAPVARNPAVGAPLGAESSPTPISHNPEVGQFIGNDSAGSNPFMQWMMMNYLQNQGPYSATQNTPANLYSGGASGGGYLSSAPGAGSYYVGASPGAGESGYIYPDQASATAAGDVGAGSGGGSGMGGMTAGKAAAGGALSAIGGVLSSFKNQPTFNYQAPNVQLPQPVTYQAPRLSPNTNVSF